MGDDPFRRKAPVANRVDYERIAVGRQVDAQDVELFAIGNNTPINSHIVGENAEFHKTTQLPDHLEPLDNRVRMTCRLDENIATIPVGHFFYDLYDVVVEWIENQIGPKLFGQFQSVRLRIHDDQFFWAM